MSPSFLLSPAEGRSLFPPMVELVEKFGPAYKKDNRKTGNKLCFRYTKTLAGDTPEPRTCGVYCVCVRVSLTLPRPSSRRSAMNSQADNEGPRKGGRKRKPPDELRGQWIGFRGTAAERAAIQERASAAGFSTISDFARAALGDVPARVRRGPSYPPEVVAQLRRLGNNVNQTLREARFGNFPPQVATAAEEALQDVSKFLRSLLHGPEH